MRTFLRTAVVAAVLLAVACRGGLAAEMRAFWVDAFGAGFRSQGEVEKLLGRPGDANIRGDIRNANCNAVFVEVRLRGNVCYPSALREPYMPGLTPSNFNALQAMIDAAHDTTGGKQRVEVHAWIVTFANATGSYVSPIYYEHNNPADPANYWITRTESGAEPSEKAFDPGHPGVQRYVNDVCMDLVTNFDIDGLHFDYIRFTASDQGYNPTSVARFNARYGRTGQPLSTDDLWEQWRRDQVTAIVRKAYAGTQAVKPHVKVSGAFGGGTPGPASSTRSAFLNTRPYYQYYADWDGWLQEGIVDLAVPMIYFDLDGSYAADYTKWLNFVKDRKAGRHAVPGPGIYLNSLSNAISMLLMTRQPSPSGNHGQGFCGYSYRVPFSGGTWAQFQPALVAQVTPSSTDIPSMPWKTSPTLGHIRGTVVSAADGLAVDGAIIGVTGPVTRGQIADGTGFFAFIDLPPGSYMLNVSKGGFVTQVAAVTVSAGTVQTKDFVLQPTGCTYPVISNVSVQGVTATNATIVWQTDIPSDSAVEYGPTDAYGLATPTESTLVTTHTVSLTGLTPSTQYHFRVVSSPNGGCASYSPDATFTTAGGASVPDVIVESRGPSGSLTPSPSYLEAGAWGDSTAKSGAAGLSGAGSRYATTYSAKSATFVPNLPAAGPYDVYVTWGSSSNGANTNFKVTSGGSVVHSQNIDQSSAAGNQSQWILLGQWEFGQGQSAANASVKIDGSATTNPRGISSPRLMSDAAKFVFRGVIGDTIPPSQPAALTAEAADTSSVSLQWTASTDNVGVAGYRLYRGGVFRGSVSGTAFTDTGLSANTSYAYQVSAVDQAGNESVWSSTGTAVTLSEPPSPLTVVCNRDSGTWYSTNGYSFSTVGGFGPGTVARYRVAWTTSAGYTWGSGTEIDWPSGSILRSAGGAGSWYLHLKGFNSAGVENGEATLGPYNYDPTAPPAPAVLDTGNYTSDVETLTASWLAEDPESGLERTEYRLLEDGGQVVRDWTDAGQQQQVFVDGLSLAQGKVYLFEVRATNNAGLVSAVGSSDGIKVVAPAGRIGEVRLLPDGTEFVFSIAKPVLASFATEFYLGEPDRSAGILVQAPPPGAGLAARVGGRLTTTPGGERAITDADVHPEPTLPVPAALNVTTRLLGGAAVGDHVPAVGSYGGLPNTGLLVTVWGRVTSVGDGHFYLDDGAGLNDGSGSVGVRVEFSGALPETGSVVIVTGISAAFKQGSAYQPLVRALLPGGLSPL